ncbi:hypothetical protein HK101_009721 [Irineochytrium annulatum]|nr:hypothetical protein HK101_009721 [Irineochytrium annulatum]
MNLTAPPRTAASSPSAIAVGVDASYAAGSGKPSHDGPVALEAGLGASANASPLIFTDLGCSIHARPAGSRGPPERRVLLEGVTGCVRPGQLLAVMGPSGAGKSTFLDVLSRRTAAGGKGGAYMTTGRVFLGEGADAREVFNTQQMATVASYVEQSDDLLGVLTVRETIAFAAQLNNPYEPTAERMARVDALIASLGLSKVSSTIVGNALQKGLSGGQMRRTTVACSLITRPQVLFLDEPTSGLDATTAREVVAAVRRIAKAQKMVVVATIHQPNFETLSLFDELLLLANGRVMYNGPIASLGDFFEAFGTPVPRFVNPADHAVDLVNTDFESSSATHEDSSVPLSRKDGHDVAQDLLEFRARRDAESESAIKALIGGGEVARLSDRTIGGAGIFFQHTLILCRRGMLNYVRNLLAYGVRLGMYIGMGIMMATIWVNLGTRDSTINDRLSVYFFSVAFLSFMSVAGIPAFLEERSVFIRERHNGLYKTGPYVVANSLMNVPFLFLCTLSFVLLSYFAIGLQSDPSAFFRFLAFLFLAIYAAESQVVLVSALLPIFLAALAIGSFMNGFWMCVQGYFIKSISLPRFWYYSFHFMDYQTYAFELLANSDLKGVNFSCAKVDGAPNGCACAYPSSTPETCTVSGSDVLSYLDIGNVSMSHWSIILIAIIVIYRILFYVVLLRSK